MMPVGKVGGIAFHGLTQSGHIVDRVADGEMALAMALKGFTMPLSSIANCPVSTALPSFGACAVATGAADGCWC